MRGCVIAENRVHGMQCKMSESRDLLFIRGNKSQQRPGNGNKEEEKERRGG